jgi:hypothetical protein
MGRETPGRARPDLPARPRPAKKAAVPGEIGTSSLRRKPVDLRQFASGYAIFVSEVSRHRHR